MKILDTGILKKYMGKTAAIDYKILMLGKENIPGVLKLQDIIMDNIPSLEIYKPDSREFIEQCLEDGGLLIGVIAEERLISYRFINFPRYEERNFGIDLNLPVKELIKVAHFESALVHPDYVGNGLQRETFRISEEIVYDMGYYHICTLISPNNFYSLNNVLKRGLTIRKIKKKYANAYDGEGQYRCILYKSLKEEIRRDYYESISISNRDIRNQVTLLEEGYVGYSVEGNGKGFNIIYGR